MKQKIHTVINLNNRQYKLIINRKKIKHTYIRVDDENNIVVNTNYLSSRKLISQLVYDNQDKILKIIHNKIKKTLATDKLAYLGKIYDIVRLETSNFGFEIFENKIVLSSRYPISSTVDLFYKKTAQKILPLRLNHCLKHFSQIKELKPELKIRKMKSRYGTCYYKKNLLNLNSYLMKYKEDVIDYVIYHELCHFIHHNHSGKFYELLNKVCPDNKLLKLTLNKY